MRPYFHTVQLHETTLLGAVDSADYIRWTVDACIDMMDQLGCPFVALQQKGIVCPTTAVSANYHAPCFFGDRVRIDISVVSFNGIKLVLRYTMTNETSEKLCCEAQSEHVFMDAEGRFVRLRRDVPALYAAVMRLNGHP